MKRAIEMQWKPISRFGKTHIHPNTFPLKWLSTYSLIGKPTKSQNGGYVLVHYSMIIEQEKISPSLPEIFMAYVSNGEEYESAIKDPSVRRGHFVSQTAGNYFLNFPGQFSIRPGNTINSHSRADTGGLTKVFFRKRFREKVNKNG